jgi:hypothetical protein
MSSFPVCAFICLSSRALVVMRQFLPRHLQHKVFVSLHSFGAKECITPLIDARWTHNAHSTAGWGWSSSVGYRSEHYRGGAGGVAVPVPVGGSRVGAGEYSSGPTISSGSTSGRGDGDGSSKNGSVAAESYENVKRTASSSSCTVGTEKGGDGDVDGDACVDTVSLSVPCSGGAVVDVPVPVDLSMRIAEINVNDSNSETSYSSIVRSTSGGGCGGANSTKRKSNFSASSTISMRVGGSLRVIRKPLRSIKSRKLIKHAKHG